MNNTALGIDIGAVSLSAAVVDASGTVLAGFSQAHQGDIPAALRQLGRQLAEQGLDKAMAGGRIAATGRAGNRLGQVPYFDSQLCCIRSVQQGFPEVRSVLLVGGETFRLFRFSAEGKYRDSRSSTSCAAGTGSFLDQQAGRLQLKDSAALARLAADNKDAVPKVATRCAVFAKTDLIHAQQEGYSVGAISAGLCRGLARNLFDTLCRGQQVETPIVITGGVACNPAVVQELERLIGSPLQIDVQALFQGAAGAAMLLLDSGDAKTATGLDEGILLEDALAGLWGAASRDTENRYPPLELRLSDYPDFACHERSLFPADPERQRPAVEVELFEAFPSQMDVYLGVDIGSTSTKAVLTDMAGRVYAGVYTRTSGRPVAAFQALCAALEELAARHGADLSVVGSATTGSGRKFIGSIIDADEILDEISAHARAAVELHPEVDTILEIGGQDAKFTTVHNGLVTLSIMNTVCAAGTGSFLEEQALRLGVKVQDFAARAMGQQAPHVSDRCTVFMERDVNHLLAEGADVAEALTAAIHAVRENYLRKVAVPKHIGKVVMFQGATARNKALVAAFEQELQRPIFVSQFCHLTGALGAALTLRDALVVSSRFRGLDLHKAQLPIRSEVCELCSNNCKITLTDIAGQTVAFGFLCGRDYDTQQYVNRNTSGFDLLSQRRKLERRYSHQAGSQMAAAQQAPYTVGLPVGLNMVEDASYWQDFFADLGIPVIKSDIAASALSLGKQHAEAEFCAPVSVYFGHVRRLSEQADYVFTPLYLHNNGEKGPGEQQYCYYTQHAPASVLPFVPQEKCISPLVATAFGTGRIKQELVEAFGKRNGWTIGAPAIQAAMDRASTLRLQRQQAYRELYEQYSTDQQTADVVLIGRPYLVLDPIMNKGIPQVFGTLGVRTFFQDMLPEAPQIDTQYRDLLQEVPWYFAKAAIRAAVKAARTPGLYPVYVTAFKCGPDSFAVDFFRRIMEAAGKPYLVLELDEHDSAVGYETRIEAAVRTFRNHLQEAPPVADSPEALPEAAAEKPDSITKPPKNWIQGLGSRLPRFGLTGIRLPVIRLGQVGKLWSAGGDSPEEIPAQLRPWYRKNPRGATLLLPNWDSLTLPLLAAVLRGQGVDARVMPESESLIRRSLHTNTGQCLPMNVIAENYIETVDREGLDPAKTVLWMADANFACNIPLFPLYIRNLIHERGRGFEHTQLYVGEVTFKDISPLAPIHAYFAFLFAGILRRLGCRIRPYEYNPGQTDEVIAECLGLFQQVFENPGVDRLEVVKTVLAKFEAIPYDREARRPKIALFGDFYVRDNDVFNQDIIHTIEAHGGEVITTPYSDFAMMTAENYFARWLKEGQYVRLAAFKLLKAAMNYLEKAYQSEFERVLQQSAHSYDDDASDILARYNLRVDHSGETADNVLKTWYIKKHYPDVALFVQLNPGFCCAGLVTEAIASRIEEVTGVPVVSLTYDAIGGSKNDTIIPYIHAAVNQ